MRKPRASFAFRRQRLRIGRLLVFLLAFFGCSYSQVHSGSLNLSEVRQVESGIQALRRLTFTRPVPVVIDTQDQAEQVMAAEVKRDHTDEQLRISGQVGVLVGLYPGGIDLKGTTLKLLRNQVAGFYDFDSKKMILVRSLADVGLWGPGAFSAGHDPVGEMLLAHELTHALQGQHFGIGAMLDGIKDNDDRELALKSVAEGDATLAGFAYAKGGMSDALVDSLLSRLADMRKEFAAETKGTPRGLSIPLIFQYVQGVRFVGEAYRRGGWAAVDALYRKPPESTRQIIDPSLYFDHPKPAARVTLAGYGKILKGWIKFDGDTYGELLLRVILERAFGEHAPETALAKRWAGDRMIVMRKGNAITVLWLLAMSDDDSAKAFASAYERVLARSAGPDRPWRVDRRSNAVLAAIGPGASHFAQLGPAIWKASSVGGAAPPAAPSPHAASFGQSTLKLVRLGPAPSMRAERESW
jgi:hypothetical protein